MFSIILVRLHFDGRAEMASTGLGNRRSIHLSVGAITYGVALRT